MTGAQQLPEVAFVVHTLPTSLVAPPEVRLAQPRTPEDEDVDLIRGEPLCAGDFLEFQYHRLGLDLFSKTWRTCLSEYPDSGVLQRSSSFSSNQPKLIHRR